MRLLSSPLRALTLASSLALLSLAFVSPADASPRRSASGPICDPQTPIARRLPHKPKSFGGPLKRPSSHALAGLQDITARMRRGTRAFLGYPVAAIQNDSPVNDTDYGDWLTPSLRPLEIVCSIDLQPRSRSFSPRSPRGPPLPA